MRMLCVAVGVWMLLMSAASAEVASVSIVAYINQRMGCQRHTEQFLKDLDEHYGDRVSLEFVDFGGAGRQRWRADGMHCMGIRLNGSTQAAIVYRGVPMTVRFEMPEGYMWKHEELATAVRQMLEGVVEGDRQPPRATVREEDGTAVLVIGGSAVGSFADAARLRATADALSRAEPAAIVQEELAVRCDDGRAAVLLRGEAILELVTADAAARDVPLRELAEQALQAIAGAYPRKTRPFPGQGNPARRRQR